MTRRNLTHLAALLLVLLLTACGSDENPEALVASAKALLAKNDRAAAIIQLRNALQKSPDLAEARFLLGKAELETGDLAGAQKELRRALELKYPPDDAIPLLAEAMLRSGNLKNVIDEFGSTEAKAPEAPAADLPAPLAAAMQQMGVADKNADKSDKPVVTTPDARAQLQTILGKAQFALGNFDAAGAAFAAAVAAKPDYPPALLGQARLAGGTGDLPGALTLVDSALAKSPKLADAWAFKGDIQLAQGQQEDALASYRKALDAEPEYLPAHVAIVSLLAQQGKLEDASKQLGAMRKLAPKHPETLYLQAQLASRQNDFPAARESIQQLLSVAPNNLPGLLLAGAIDFQLKSYTQAEASLLKVVSAAPGHPLARRLLASTYLRTGEPRKALEALKPILDKVGNDSDMLMLVGDVYMQNGNPTEAAGYFEKAAALDPKNTGKRTTLAIVHTAQGDSSEAVRELERAVVDDTTTRGDLALIAVYIRQHEFTKALTAIDVLEKKQPGNPLPHTLRGQVLLDMKDVPGARKSFERALAINPAYLPAADGLARLDLADNKPDDARKRMETLLAKDPKQTQALLALAGMRARAGASTDEVATLIGKAIAANPTEVTPHLVLIEHYLRSKDPKKAVIAGQDALAAIPDRPEILEALGQAQQAAGAPNQAIATYSKWARLRPDLPLPLLRIAEAQIAAKETGAAMQSLRKALELKPDLVDAQRGIIALELAADRMQQALAIAREVQKQRPKDSVGYLLEGEIYTSKKNWAQAAAAYRTGLKEVLDTELAMRLYGALVAGGVFADAQKLAAAWVKDYPKDNVFRLYVANSALERKDFAIAHQYYLALLDADPNSAMVLNNLAWTGGQTKDPKALEYAETANRLAPNQPPIMDTLGTLLIEKGDTTRGLELLQKASALAPTEPTLRLSLAKGLIKANQKDAAKKELDELAKLGDKFSGQAEVTKLMHGL